MITNNNNHKTGSEARTPLVMRAGLWSPVNANTANNLRGTGTGQKPTCYECGTQRHFKRECSKLKNNNNRGNPA
ncbi:putative reverse transcriptase domain-containing protein [Tanacetum coccineum]